MERRLALATLMLTAGRAGSQALGVLATLITARLLTPDDFGLIAVAMAVFALAAALTELPVASLLVRLPEVDRSDTDTAWTINLIRGTLAAFLMLAAGPVVAHALDEPRMIALTAALSLYPFLLGLRNPAFELYARAMDFRFEALTEFLARLAAFFVAAGLAWWLRSYWALPLSLLASGAAALVLSFLLRPYRPRLCLSRAGRFMNFSLWMSAARIMESVRLSSATLFLGRFVSPATAGALSIASRFADQIEYILVVPFERSLYAGFSSIQDRPAQTGELYLRTAAAIAMLLLPACTGIMLSAGQIIFVLAGPGWEQAATALGWMALMTGTYGLAAPALSLMTAAGAVRWIFLAQLASAFVHFPLLVLLGFHAGFEGALLAMSAGSAVWMCAILAWPILRLGISPAAHIRAWLRPALASGMMAALLSLPGGLAAPAGVAEPGSLARLALICVSGFSVYTVTLLALWLLAGRPDGPERQAMRVLERLLPTASCKAVCQRASVLLAEKVHGCSRHRFDTGRNRRVIVGPEEG